MFNFLYKYLNNKKFLLGQAAKPSGSGFCHVRFFNYLSAANQDKQNHHYMAKVQIKSEKITAFGGIFFVLDKFDSILSSVIDSHLGLRSTLIGYQSARLYGLQTSTDTSWHCRLWLSSLESRPQTESRVSCSDSSLCLPSG